MQENKSSVQSKKIEMQRDDYIERAYIMPGLIILSFITFIAAFFFLIQENYPWSGSLLIFSFLVNLYGIYLSFIDEPGTRRNVNLTVKMILMIGEIMIINWYGVQSGLYLFF